MEQEKREMIIDAAKRVVSEKGFSRATLDEIAQLAGVAKGTIYLYFDSKEDLFSSLVLVMHDRLVTRLKKATENLSGAWEKVKGITYAFIDFMEKNRDVYLSMVFEAPSLKNKKIAGAMHEKLNIIHGLVLNIIEDGRQTGVFYDDTCSEIQAALIEGTINKAIFYRIVHGKNMSLYDIYDDIVYIIQRALKK